MNGSHAERLNIVGVSEQRRGRRRASGMSSTLDAEGGAFQGPGPTRTVTLGGGERWGRLDFAFVADSARSSS